MISDIHYEQYNKEDVVLILILFYPCITFRALKQLLYLYNIDVSDDYLRKILQKLQAITKKYEKKKKLINYAYIPKAE